MAEVVETARAQSGVDADRVALWFFSGGGPLAASVLDDPPQWLRTIVLSYPMLRPLGDNSGYAPAADLGTAGQVPILLTRVGREHPGLAAEQDEFVASAQSAGANLSVIEVPDGHHAFDVADDDDRSRHALIRAFDLVEAHVA